MQANFTSSYVNLEGAPVHIADFGGADFGGADSGGTDGVPIVCVHGLGGSHVNWVSIASGLGAHGRVTAIDLPGFGLSPPAGRRGTVDANRRVLDAYLATLGEPAVVVANSMGGVAALLQAASAPETVAGLVLISPVLPLPPGVRPDPVVAAFFGLYMMPGLGRAALAGRRRVQTPEEMALFTLRLCSARVARIPLDVIDRHVAVGRRRARIPGLDEAFLRAARSVLATVGRRREFDRMAASVTAPTLVIHGRRDRLVRYQSAVRLSGLRPDWRVEILDDVGHIPMLEMPVEVNRLIGDWWSTTRA